ncbi:TPA: thiolase family protein [Pseudomonas aeruginosa]|uniref:thiolase family protein n=1 Tax=Pseudomonas aeruginosa group TaxID=136841 RepID=UPI0012D8EC1F|nr:MULTISPECIES: thiolase family protein [Pseudomonas aeruginosa group]MBH9459181.1 thiolase family protein [Pseudomonas aeruginosa]MBH9465979.1 thiolase family protein [Pseudomonas aeruginosa]MUI47064.1 thiolase family protein [Pseudomonas aeruginosa]QPZ62078.1 thiolase family protein [Pseudomonas aeruginosa]HCF0993048.1 thiolase family protein [Pseudomonas aeruginosa]
MSDVYLLGVGMTRFGKHPGESVKSLTASAVAAALADAGLAAEDIQAAWFANTRQPMLEGQNTIRGQIALRAAGLSGIPICTLENACASGTTALWSAMMALRSGMADVVLIAGAEKMVYPDRPEKVAASFAGGTDVHDREAVLGYIRAMGGNPPEGGRSLFMDIYAAQARGHMARFASSVEDLARIAAKNHCAGSRNPNAQYRTPFSVEQVLADKAIVYPFTRAMCAPVSDGAAAAVLVSERVLQQHGAARAVRVRSCVLRSAIERPSDDYSRHIGRLAALQAYEQAGIGAADVDLVEVHDATAFAELQQIENLGLAERGTVGARLAMGDFALGGKCPVNPSGGLLAKGHPVAATGIAQLFELVTQLRGEAGARQVERARIAVAENGGGFLGVEEGVTAVTVLEQPQ